MKRELTRIFSKNLERLLYERKKSQADMARYMHVSSATASEWVNWKKMPRADKLQSLANWLSVDLSDLSILLIHTKKDPRRSESLWG